MSFVYAANAVLDGHWLWQVQQLLTHAYVLGASVVSDSLWPHELQPERFLCPWDSPGKNWSGLPFPSPGDLPDPRITPTSLSYVSCMGRQVLNHWATSVEITTDNFKQEQTCWLWCWYCLLRTTHTHTHSHTLTHGLPTLHNLPGNSLHCLFSGALCFSLIKASQRGISVEEEWRQTYIASAGLASEQKDISYETKF